MKQNIRKLLIVSMLVVVSVAVRQANAAITGVTGPNSSAGTAPAFIGPPSAVLDDVVTNTGMQGFDEAQGVMTTIPHNVDDGVIPAGTWVDSHMIFLNSALPGTIISHNQVDWTFSGDIIGVMSDEAGTLEAASTFELGAPGTTYPAAAFATRGMEKSYGDNLEMLDSSTLRVNMRVSEPGDWIRVITTAAAEGVDIPDPGLEAAIRAALGISETDPITVTDLEELTSLDAHGRGITDLTGLEYCVNLNRLYLGDNEITDISALSGLIHLEILWLENNRIDDISALSELTNLDWLWLDNNAISDVSALSKLTKLEHLRLNNNYIGDISALSELINLEVLDLHDNFIIIDISALSEMTKMWELYLGGNDITNISALSKLTVLGKLGLSSNDIIDISPLSEMTLLGELYLTRNDVSDISPLSELHILEHLGLGQNNISDISALSELDSLDSIDLRSNDISDIQPLVDNYGLRVLDRVYLTANPLSYEAIYTDIPVLQDRGVNVYFSSPAENLIAAVDGLDLFRGSPNPLRAQLKAADRAAERGNDEAAIRHLSIFIDQCHNMRGTKLTESDASSLILDAEGMIYWIESP